MRKAFLFTLIVLMWSGSTAAVTNENSACVVYRIRSTTPLRTGPDSERLALAEIPINEYALVLRGPHSNQNQIWWWVDYAGLRGWIHDTDNLEQVDYAWHEAGGLRFCLPAGMFMAITTEDLPLAAHIGSPYPPRRIITLDGSPASAEITIIRCDNIAPLCHEQAALYGSGRLPLAPGRDALLPFPPYQYFVTRAGRISYAGGSGLSGVLFSPPGTPETEIVPQFSYGFSSVTDDNQYMITLQMPLMTLGTMPAFWTPEQEPYFLYDARGYTGYLFDFFETLRNLPPEAFTPRLLLLDAIAGSFEILEPINIAP